MRDDDDRDEDDDDGEDGGHHCEGTFCVHDACPLAVATINALDSREGGLKAAMELSDPAGEAAEKLFVAAARVLTRAFNTSGQPPRD